MCNKVFKQASASTDNASSSTKTQMCMVATKYTTKH